MGSFVGVKSMLVTAGIVALKLWLVEGFVVPTGAMVKTLRGYHKHVKCPSCGQEFDVNASTEAITGPDRPTIPTNGCTCPNCRRILRLVNVKRDRKEVRPGADGTGKADSHGEIADPGLGSGDRFLLGKGPLFKRPPQ